MLRRGAITVGIALGSAVLTASGRAQSRAPSATTTEAEEDWPAAAGPGLENPLARDAAAVEAGRALYLERCAVCYGQDATGSMAANLVRSRTVAHGADEALYRVIVQGIPGMEMPPHGRQPSAARSVSACADSRSTPSSTLSRASVRLGQT